MTRTAKILTIILLAALPQLCVAAEGQLTVKLVNKLQFVRLHQTIELSASQLTPLGEKDLNKIHVKDDTGKEVLCQAVDTDFDAYHTPDIVIFQADLGPGETKTFTVSTGTKQVYTKDQFKAYGRFVRERFDDFAWENDRIAHRTYGKALETWAGEPLTSSSMDIWSKRVPYMVIDGWYMAADYHVDHGEGLDDYSAGATRGCGGNGLWAADKLWVSKNFVNSRVLADGPIRVTFELDYEPFDANGTKVAEVKRITLDAGSNLDHFQSFYKPQGNGKSLVCGIGIKKVADAKKDFNAERGSLCIWEPMEKNQGMQGIALIVDPKALQKEAEDRQNNLLLAKADADNSVSYWAGFFWDKSGQFPGYDAWKTYVDQFSQGLASPIEVSVSAK
jgi:hypothetical protein